MNAIEQLKQVPGPIRRWMGSEDVVDLIEGIEREFNLDPDDAKLTFLLFDLEVKNFTLDDFLGEIAYDFGITEEQARPILEAVRTRILAPIAPELVAYGIGTASDYPAMAAPPLPSTAGALSASIPAVPAATPTPAPAKPAAPAPAPVSLYHDAVASQAAAPAARLGVRDTGDISGTVRSAPAPQRAARIDLGMPAPSPRKEEEFKSIFVERATPLPQIIDYGTPAPAVPTDPGMPPAPVPLAKAPAPSLDRSTPFISPQVEAASPPAAPAEEGTAPSGGFLSSLIARVAPWHAKKFARVSVEEPLLPAASINYTDAPAPPIAPDAPAPVPIGGAPPASPKPLS